MNNKTLLIILVILLGIWGANKLFLNQSDRTFKSEIVAVDTAKVDRILVYPKTDNFEELSLQKEENGWIATKGNISTPALNNVIQGVLTNLDKIQTKRVVAKSEEKWTEYEVTETTGTRIKVYAGSNELADFIIGRFNFNQQMRTASTYVRLTKEDEIYEVDGFLGMTLGSGFDSYRDKTIAKVNKADVTDIAVSGDEGFTISKVMNNWMLNSETALDSVKVDGFLTGLANVSGAEFANGFDETANMQNLIKTMTIKSNNEIEPLRINVFRDTTLAKPFVINSNRNKDVYFLSDSTGVFGKFFKPILELQ